MLGTIFGLLSAIGYTAANVCLREASNCDPVWVSCIKATPTVFLVGPWVWIQYRRGQLTLPSGSIFLVLIASGVFGQLAGNVAFQWALGVVGVAMTVPLTLGLMIFSGALLGHFVLGEAVTPRITISSGVLLVAVCVLSVGAQAASKSVATTDGATVVSALHVAAGVGSACLAGFAYAVLGLAVRHAGREHVPATLTVFIVGMVGMLGLTPLTAMRIGIDGMLETEPYDLAVMLGAGLFNAAAFVCLAQSLRRVSIVFVNALNATQAAMAAVVGVVLFHEALTSPMVIGVSLSMVGLLLMRPRRPGQRGAALEGAKLAAEAE